MTHPHVSYALEASLTDKESQLFIADTRFTMNALKIGSMKHQTIRYVHLDVSGRLIENNF